MYQCDRSLKRLYIQLCIITMPDKERNAKLESWRVVTVWIRVSFEKRRLGLFSSTFNGHDSLPFAFLEAGESRVLLSVCLQASKEGGRSCVYEPGQALARPVHLLKGC